MASTTAPAAGKTTAIAPAQLHTFHKIEKQYGDRDHGADWRGMTGSQRHIEESRPKNRQAMSEWRGTGSGDRP